jgi:hypothetical protein
MNAIYPGGKEMIKKTILIFLLVVVLCSQSVFAATKVVPLPEVNKPDQQIVVDGERLFVLEGTTIYIYSLKDLKLIKKFGKRGEGPQEFKTNAQMGPLGALFIDAHTKNLLVKSVGKLSWYTKDGAFINEVKLPFPIVWQAYQFGKMVVLRKMDFVGVRQFILNAYNDKFEAQKEFYRVDDTFQMGKGLNVLKNNPTQAVYKGKLFVAPKNELEIKVYDQQFKELYTIKHPLKRIKVTEEFKKDLIQFFKTSPMTKQYFDFLKPIRFPNVYPAIAQMFVTGDKIYIITFEGKKRGENIQDSVILVFDIKGKFLKKMVQPLAQLDPIVPSPFTIFEGKLYQLIENEDEEQWELHITDMKL